MDISNIQFQISELRNHVDELLRAIENGSIGEDGDDGYAVDLGHLLDHINLAWNLRHLSPEEFPVISSATFEKAMNTVPNFGLNRTLAPNEYYKICGFAQQWLGRFGARSQDTGIPLTGGPSDPTLH